MARETDLQTACRLLKGRRTVYDRNIARQVTEGPQITLEVLKARQQELTDVIAFLAELDREIHAQ